MTESLEQWLGREYQHAATAMLTSVSACDIVKERPGFGQTVRPIAGSIVASPVPGSWDPDPDYFFHWFRDSAIVIDAVRLLYEAGHLGAEALTHFADFVRFSLSLKALDGRALVELPQWRSKVMPDFVQYLRGDDLLMVSGDAVYADTRVNPDGTLDISRWTRPQHDGAPLRALSVLRWLRTLRSRHARAAETLSADTLADAERLLRTDLALTAAHWREPSLDIWEEELGHHYFTLRVAAAALNEGAEWLRAAGEAAEATVLRAEAQAIRETLDGFWLPDAAYYRSRNMPAGTASTKMLDIAVILAAVHAGDGEEVALRARSSHARHARKTRAAVRQAVSDQPATGREGAPPRWADTRATSTFRAAPTISRRWALRNFVSWPPRLTRPAAERARSGSRTATRFSKRSAPSRRSSGDLSEQFDQRTGEQTSAKHLAWSYAGFISSVTARRAVLAP